ncbi:hypothetical protein T492DRAFT_926111 [Pavlovales sp. CCMP2436]|nr:hypothetical protein T492DRAFT_926111 [Pavlovales sp. CCMP2436]
MHAADGDADSTVRCVVHAHALSHELFGQDSLEAADVATALLPACADVRPQLAVKLADAALRSRASTLGHRHPSTAAAHRNLGLSLLAAGEGENAVGEYESALQIIRLLHGDDSATVGDGVELLATVRRQALGRDYWQH